MKESIVGKSLNRVGGLPRVLGTQVYVGDVKLPNMLHAKLVHLDCAHARIRSIDTSEASKVDGVWAVLSAADLPKPIRIIELQRQSLSKVIRCPETCRVIGIPFHFDGPAVH